MADARWRSPGPGPQLPLLALLVSALLAALCCAPALAGDPEPGGGLAAAEPARANAIGASAVKVSGVRVLEYGVFSSNVARRQRVASVADGIRDKAKDFALVKRGSRVEARLGTGFGLRYQVTGAPRGALVLLDVVVRHPQMVNPDTRQPMTHSHAQYERAIGAVEHSLWSFDTPAGLIPGLYSIEILHQGRVLARQEFQVTLTEPGKP